MHEFRWAGSKLQSLLRLLIISLLRLSVLDVEGMSILFCDELITPSEPECKE